jgi:ATP-binding cassette subfamily B multidrug efflux pump
VRANSRLTEGAIRFDHVKFHYGKDAGLFDDLVLDVRPGEKIGLVGRSGAGKSTLVNLLLRFYDVEGGRILIDGQDVALVGQDSLRANIGMVTQDTSLLHRSVKENILYGRPDASEADMVEAAAGPRRMSSLPHLQTRKAGPDMTPMSANGASSFPAANASASRLRG